MKVVFQANANFPWILKKIADFYTNNILRILFLSNTVHFIKFFGHISLFYSNKQYK